MIYWYRPLSGLPLILPVTLNSDFHLSGMTEVRGSHVDLAPGN